MFNKSVMQVLVRRPFRWTTAPTFNSDLTIATAGVKQTPSGVFILLDESIVKELSSMLDDAEIGELRAWLYKVSTETPLPAGHVSAALWNIPLWAGTTRATLLRIPALVWDDPTTVPPIKVRYFFNRFYKKVPSL